jgi:sugar lactone lactonase YvrE
MSPTRLSWPTVALITVGLLLVPGTLNTGPAVERPAVTGPAGSDPEAAGPADPQVPVHVETLSGELNGGSGGISVGPDGSIYVADFGQMLGGGGIPGTRVFVVSPDGESRVFADGFQGASGNEMGPDGILYQSNIAGSYISRVHPDGTNERWVSEGIRGPVGIVMDEAGHLVVANCGSNSLQRVAADGTSTPFVSSPLLACPNGITVDARGIFYVANFANGNVIRVTPDGEASRLATIPGGNNGHLVHHDGVLYVVARSAHQIYRVSLEGQVELLAGTGEQGLDDGPAHQATFSYPNDIGVSPDGRYLYVNDVADLESTGALLSPMVVRRIRIG